MVSSFLFAPRLKSLAVLRCSLSDKSDSVSVPDVFPETFLFW